MTSWSWSDNETWAFMSAFYFIKASVACTTRRLLIVLDSRWCTGRKFDLQVLASSGMLVLTFIHYWCFQDYKRCLLVPRMQWQQTQLWSFAVSAWAGCPHCIVIHKTNVLDSMLASKFISATLLCSVILTHSYIYNDPCWERQHYKSIGNRRPISYDHAWQQCWQETECQVINWMGEFTGKVAQVRLCCAMALWCLHCTEVMHRP